ncbi:MAG: hypothetical protein WD875_09080 [Pirellulales bacterium]
MSLTPRFASRAPRFLGTLLLASIAVVVGALPAGAANPKSSLEFVPADAHVYVSVSRLGEHVQTIAKSNWWAQVQANEVFQRTARPFLPQFGPGDGANESPEARFLADPANLPLMLLAGEMASEEIFFYSDRRAVDMLALYGETSQNMVVTYMGISFMFATGQFTPFNDGFENVLTERILRPVRDNLDKIAVPQMVLGFKIKDAKNAEAVLAKQVDKFREALGHLGLSAPSDKVLEETVDGENCWIWRFEGDSIPWAAMLDVPGGMLPSFEPIFAHLRKLNGVVTLCVHDGYVLIGVADSPVWIEKLGTGPLLADRDDFAPLKKMADQPITGVCYASREARAAWTVDETDLRDVVKSIKQTLEASDVSAATIKDVGRALDGMADELRPHLPRPGSMLTVAHTTSEGVEFTTFDRSEPIHVDGSQPLAVLDHVGHTPVAFWAGRAKGTEEYYRALASTFAGGYDLIEKHVFPAMQTEIQTQVRPFFDRMKPVAKRFDRAMRDLVLPPLSGGDSAIVLASRLTYSPWSLGGPQSELQVPMPLPAVVFTVKDIDQLHAGIKEMRGVYNDGFAVYAETVPFADPLAKLDDPKSREFDEGTIYWHVLPKEWGFDKRIAANYGLAKNLAVFSLVPLDTRDMLGQSTLKLPAPLDDRQAPLAAATYVDVPRVCEIVVGAMLIGAPFGHEWVEEIHTNEKGEIITRQRQVPTQNEGDESAKNFRDLLALAQTVPSYASATKVDGKSTITHGILRIVDLPATEVKEVAPPPTP